MRVVVNTHTEHYFQDVFKNARMGRKGAYLRKGNTSRVEVASYLWIMDTSFTLLNIYHDGRSCTSPTE